MREMHASPPTAGEALSGKINLGMNSKISATYKARGSAKNATAIFIFFAILPLSAFAQTQVIRMYGELDALIAEDAKLEKLSDNPGGGILEGPVWDRQGQFLLFSDMAAKAINKWDPRTGTVSRFLDQSGSNGVTIDPQGRVVYTSRLADRGILRLDANGARTMIVNKYEGKRLNGPNDLVYKSDGALFFTDNTGPPPPLTLADKDPSACWTRACLGRTASHSRPMKNICMSMTRSRKSSCATKSNRTIRS